MRCDDFKVLNRSNPVQYVCSSVFLTQVADGADLSRPVRHSKAAGASVGQTEALNDARAHVSVVRSPAALSSNPANFSLVPQRTIDVSRHVTTDYIAIGTCYSCPPCNRRP